MKAAPVSAPGFTGNYPFDAPGLVGLLADCRMDTDLRLNYPGSVEQHLIGSSLSLGLGWCLSPMNCKESSASVCTTVSPKQLVDKVSSVGLDLDFSLSLGSTVKGRVQHPSTVDLELSLSAGLSESDITNDVVMEIPPLVGEPSMVGGLMSCQWKSGTITGPPSHGSVDQRGFPLGPTRMYGTSKKFSAQYRGSMKICEVGECGKGARGASGRCISHGGGRRCQKSGCHKGAEGRTVFCKAHGGGRRCEFLGCTKSAEGRTDHCIAHGGGRRCGHEGCARAARGKSGLCIRHGGGKRCQHENCTKSAEGLSGLCILHGGGRRCQFASGCTKGAQGSTMFCKAHGGGKRCTFAGCTKGAEGSTPFCKGHGGGKRCSFQGGGICTKSVHGGTAFCVAHGGGKRCAASGCTKSARGRTDHCVRHGGGKRCQFPSCSKSAQGSTDFCKAHGKSKTVHEDSRVHGGGILGVLIQGLSPSGEATTSAGGSDPILGSSQFSAPEGRVHGGSLMALLGSGSNGVEDVNHGHVSEPGVSRPDPSRRRY